MGRYAIELTHRGYAVTLVDNAGACLDFTRDKADEMGIEFDGYVDDGDLSRLLAIGGLALIRRRRWGGLRTALKRLSAWGGGQFLTLLVPVLSRSR